MSTSSEFKTCVKCGTTGLTWAQSMKGSWYMGYPVEHTFEDGNTIITHYAAHKCVPTPEGLAIMAERQAEREAKVAAEAAAKAAYEAELAKRRPVEADFGAVVTLTGKVTMATTIETQFGTSRIIVIQTEDYQVAKMFTTANWAWSVDFDEVITISGIVDTSEVYNGCPQTTIKRPKKVS